MPIETSKVTNRRHVRLQSLREVLADAERITKGRLQQPRQLVRRSDFHALAKSINDSIDGSDMRLAWHLKIIGPLLKKKLVRGPMAPGVNLPKSVAKVVVPGPTSTGRDWPRCGPRSGAWKANQTCAASPFLGAMTRDDWNRLHLNHAMLHMSFLVPSDKT